MTLLFEIIFQLFLILLLLGFMWEVFRDYPKKLVEDWVAMRNWWRAL